MMYSRHIIYLLSILMIIVSCNREDNKPKIEVYTFKNFQPPVTDNLQYDTLNKEIIYAGKFEVSAGDLNSSPLIHNEDVLELDTISGTIKLSATAINKIVSLEPSMKFGIPFAIFIDKEPVFSGYFWSSYSSYGSSWNCIEYNHTENVTDSKCLDIYKGNGIDALKREKVIYKNYPKLINSFKNSHRLKVKKDNITGLNRNINDLISFAYEYKPSAINLSKNEGLNSFDIDYIFNSAEYKDKKNDKDDITNIILLKQYLFHLKNSHQGFDLLSMRKGQAKNLIDYFLQQNNIQNQEFVNSGYPYILLSEKETDNTVINNVILEIERVEEDILQE